MNDNDNRRDSIESHSSISIATIIKQKERQSRIEDPNRLSLATTEALTPSRSTSTSMTISSKVSTGTPDLESDGRGRSEFGGDSAASSRYYISILTPPYAYL